MEEKLVYIETYGCQMNERDSDRMLGLLERCGYRETREVTRANLILLNTCTIRERAEEKVYSRLGLLRNLKQGNRSLIVGVAGCVAQQLGEGLLKRVGHLDLVLGTGQIPKLPELVQRVESENARLSVTGLPRKVKSLAEEFPRPQRKAPVSAFVTVMEGCDKYCTFCIVPYVKGRERSRSPEDVLAEVESLLGDGVKEVTLLGQNVNSYGHRNGFEIDLAGLLDRVNGVSGLRRVRFTTSHPADMTVPLMERFVTLDKLCEQLHLPAQSGSDRILRLMNRNYTRAQYIEKVQRLRQFCPGIALSGDIIVGFPGEREEDFLDTMSLVDEVQYDSLFSFKYSPRPGTRAASMPEQVPGPVKTRRLLELQALQRETTLKKNRALEGRTLEVLVEGRSKKDRNELSGRSRCNRVVHFSGPSGLVGEIASLKIEEGLPNCLRGSLT